MTAVGSVGDLIGWTIERALPVWGTRGFDTAAGRFHERLDATGSPLDVPYRSMVQARQIFVFAEACRVDWFPDGGDLALRAMHSLEKSYAVSDGDRLAFRFASHGPAASSHDCYGHAFVLLAIAAVYKLAPSPRLEGMADRIVRYVDRSFVDQDHGGVFDSVPNFGDGKRQNPVMHLFEAFLALAEAMPGQGYLDRATTLFHLFEQRLCDSRSGVIREHFRRDWNLHDDPDLTDLVEPGHLFEWLWLLDRYSGMAGNDVSGVLESLARAAAAGVTDAGLVVDSLSASDLQVTSPCHRLWPHTEAIKAMVVRHRQGNGSAVAAADMFARALGHHFLNRPFSGGWIDRVDGTGVPLSVDVPASSLYHLVLAALEAADAFGMPTVASSGTIR